MELKATEVGRHLAQHPYNKATLLSAGVEVSGEQYSTVIPFTQLISVKCKRGIIWGELEFELPENKVIRLHGTEWQATQLFYRELNLSWSEWGREMSEIAALILNDQANNITEFLEQKNCLSPDDLRQIQETVSQTLSALPMLKERLPEFENCARPYQYCSDWLIRGETLAKELNEAWVNACLEENKTFFENIEQQPLNDEQRRAVVSVSPSTLALAGAGCGKTAVLVARAGWLLHSNQTTPEQILILTFNRRSAEEMKSRLAAQLPGAKIAVKTFHALALDIIQSGKTRNTPSKADNKKTIQISKLETDLKQRTKFLISHWQQQCDEKKSYANGWRQWLTEELGWELNESQYWKDPTLVQKLAVRLDRWLSLVRSVSLIKANVIAELPDETRSVVEKRLRLLAPLLKAWKAELKQRQTIDFTGLIMQAINVLQKGKFTSPWQHILIDEFQDIAPQYVTLLNILSQRSDTKPTLFAAGDDWQRIYRFNGAQTSLATLFEENFGVAEQHILNTTYRFNQQIAEITNAFIQQNPHQTKKALRSDFQGKKNPITILPQQQLENLLDKLSGFVKPDEEVLILARYRYLYPDLLNVAHVRWPRLNVEFMTIHDSKGQQADYVIILGLQNGNDGFPAKARESLIEEIFLPVPDEFPDAEERRLLYVALTRARHKVWLMEDRDNPSIFVRQLNKLGAAIKRKA